MPVTRLAQFLLLIVLSVLAAACDSPTANVTPTAPPSLNVSLWVDFPTLRTKQTQAVNVTVNDLTGSPVAAATVVCVVETQDYKQTLTLPLTDVEGQSRLTVVLPEGSQMQTYTIAVTAVDSRGRWDSASTVFIVYP